ncbi:MAG: hypothetical protein ACKO5Q_28115 [Microcystaceae cyanobacterium]
MASPDRIKIGAYLTESENEALKRVADSLGVSASKAVAMAVKALDEKIQRGSKVSLPVSSEKVGSSPTVPNDLNQAIADLTSQFSKLRQEVDELKKSEPVS